METERGKVVDPGGGSNGDAKWHGLCLALAEMGRRGLIGDEMVGDLLGWAVKVCVHPLLLFGLFPVN